MTDTTATSIAPQPSASLPSAQATAFTVILAVSFCHGINDIMQSLLPAIYPLLKENYGLDFWQIGLLTFTFQVTASLLQPVIGMITDKRPMPYSLPYGMASSLIGLIVLAYAGHYALLLVGASLIGIGSAIFHPESSRIARFASGGRFGLAQSLFQVGGNFGQSMGPLLAAFIVVPFGQTSISWFAVGSLIGIIVLSRVGGWYSRMRAAQGNRKAASFVSPFPRKKVMGALIVLTLLVLTKNAYIASLSSYYTFYSIHKFGVSVQMSQVMLFLFLGASALGILLGGPFGDRYGQKAMIWFSIVGVLPFTLALPYANFEWTMVLTVLIGLILSSAFSNIVVFAQELVPGRVGTIAGIFFGFAFGMGGIAAAVLGVVADLKGIDFVFQICSYLPLLGLLTVFLPNMKEARKAQAAAR
ncbi:MULTISPECIES: MFS transporter [unclassified Mesorhizobium]|uniref:MFS transporter n=1 Tax=unclassified Mesorhizobium TaxID=325217 RepID=UPI0003CE0050|nr:MULTISPECIES: MFS transporter [unclassified Mesorhizobium]ESW66641.1 Fosmidomycin resistance protein [Mesorhizobium sp. LSJC277A00]ESY50035.1 Fosmidomycin resistance protein [Mesorhizobium sp. LNJC380A00]